MPDLTPLAINALPDLAALPALPALSPHGHSGHDIVSGSPDLLASPPILHLLQIVEDRVFPQGSQHVESLHTDSIRASSHFAMDDFYARDSAEKIVAKAAHTIETAGFHGQRVPADLDPQAVIALANQFIVTGQLPNYLRAAEIGRVVISWYDEASQASAGFGAKTVAPNRQPPLRLRLYGMLVRMWWRAPLLVLLAGWLLAGGLAGVLVKAMDVSDYRTATAFKIWAIGFLALVVFQFVATIRGALRSKLRRAITKRRG